MVNHAQNLVTALEARKAVASEINELNATIEEKKAMFLKYSGIVEYLSAIEASENNNEESSEINELVAGVSESQD